MTIMVVMMSLAFQLRGRTKTPELEIILPEATWAAVTEITRTVHEGDIPREQIIGVIPEDVTVTITEESVLY